MVNDQLVNDRYAIYNSDCMEVLPKIGKDKIFLSVYSPPFCGLYQYSSDYRDLSNCAGKYEFLDQYRFIVEEIERVMVPGRMTCVHCADIPGSDINTLYDLPGDIIKLHQEFGFKYTARFTIWKEPLGVRNRTMAKKLMHKTIVEDAAQGGNAGSDYVLVFRKKGENPIPITNDRGLINYAGSREIPHEFLKFKGFPGNQMENLYSHWIWRQYASAIWDDIRIDNVLPFREGREEDDEKHVHPLQLDVIERLVHLWSNPLETVLTPFMGVGSEVYVPVKYGRKGIGIELKKSYYNQAVKNMKSIEFVTVNDQLELL